MIYKMKHQTYREISGLEITLLKRIFLIYWKSKAPSHALNTDTIAKNWSLIIN